MLPYYDQTPKLIPASPLPRAGLSVETVRQLEEGRPFADMPGADLEVSDRRVLTGVPVRPGEATAVPREVSRWSGRGRHGLLDTLPPVLFRHGRIYVFLAGVEQREDRVLTVRLGTLLEVVRIHLDRLAVDV